MTVPDLQHSHFLKNGHSLLRTFKEYPRTAHRFPGLDILTVVVNQDTILPRTES